MIYTYGAKRLNIPDKELQSLIRNLGLTKDEAIQVWLEDNEIEINQEQEELTQKAVKSGVQKQMTRTTANRKSEKKRERKADPTKEGLISNLANYLSDYEGVDNVQIENIGKLIGFELNGEHFTLNLVRNRKKK